MRFVKPVSLLVILVSGYIFFFSGLTAERQKMLQSGFVGFTLPSTLTGPISFEFKGLASDMLLFKFMNYVGANADKVNEFDEEQWSFVNLTLQTITDLDPYFWDAYLFAEMFLALQAGKVDEANTLLLKARENLPEEWRVPFYLGFNYYSILKDNKTAARYFMEASKLPGSRPYLANLATRLTVFSFQHQVGILFLKEMINETADKRLRENLKKRLTTLELLAFLEDKITIYQKETGNMPVSLEDLVSTGILKEIPQDPYGGNFFLLPNGRVFTTSKLRQEENSK